MTVINKIYKFGKTLVLFLTGVLLWLISLVLYIVLTIVNFIYVIIIKDKNIKGYFGSSALEMDKFGNREFRSIFNALLITKDGYKFGDIRETISSVLGKNKRDGTLTTLGKILDFILEMIDDNHSLKSIKELE